jgi:RNA polymerase sigma-70 factor (ECF subfamily)
VSDLAQFALEQRLIAAQRGDTDAFGQLYAALEPAIARYVRRLSGEASDWEDLVQETFIALFRTLDRVQGPDHLRPYTFRIARNLCYDALRRGGRHEGDVSIDADSPAPIVYTLRDDTLPPDDAAHWLLMNVEVQQAIATLPDAQRQALLLFCEEELTYAEIAGVMGISIGTVKSRIFHAKKTLRGRVRPEILLALQGGLALPGDGSPHAAPVSDDDRSDLPKESYHGTGEYRETEPVSKGAQGTANLD